MSDSISMTQIRNITLLGQPVYCQKLSVLVLVDVKWNPLSYPLIDLLKVVIRLLEDDLPTFSKVAALQHSDLWVACTENQTKL